jgi:hypothetical protein
MNEKQQGWLQRFTQEDMNEGLISSFPSLPSWWIFPAIADAGPAARC